MNRKIGILISGRGSNLQAIIDAVISGRLDAEIAVVISNKSDAAGLDRARKAGIESLYVDHKAYASREQFDLAYRAVPEAEITRLVETGAMSGSAMTAAARAMEGAGATFGTPDGEALQTIGAAIGQGIYGTLLMEQAVQDYRAR